MAAEPPNLRRLLDDDQVVALCEAQRAEQPTDLHPLKRLAVAAFEAGEVLIGHDLRARPCLQEAYVLLWIQLHVQCPPLSGCLRRAIDRHHPGPGAIRSGAETLLVPITDAGLEKVVLWPTDRQAHRSEPSSSRGWPDRLPVPIPPFPHGTSPMPLPKRMASAITTDPPAVEKLLIFTDPWAGERPASN